MDRKLIFCSVFHNEQYLDLLDLFLKSLVLKGNMDEKTDVLVFTSSNLEQRVESLLKQYNLPIKMFIMPFDSLFEASFARLFIFEYPEINNYSKILYIDIDVLVCGDVNKIFNLDIENKLYAKRQGTIDCEYYGSQFYDFTKISKTTPAFSAGILLFNNCQEIRTLFKDVLAHINEHFNQGKPQPICLEQPFLNYHAITKNLKGNYDFDSEIVEFPTKLNKDVVLYHMQGGPGHYPSKVEKMRALIKELV